MLKKMFIFSGLSNLYILVNIHIYNKYQDIKLKEKIILKLDDTFIG
jgi:hypothetical protein